MNEAEVGSQSYSQLPEIASLGTEGGLDPHARHPTFGHDESLIFSQPGSQEALALPNIQTVSDITDSQPILTIPDAPAGLHQYVGPYAGALPAFPWFPCPALSPVEYIVQLNKPTHHSLMKPEHKNSRAARRGPMDEMRQLVRILVRLMPNSAVYLPGSAEGGGGNRVSEDQIKDYLRKCLGEAPQPEWGLSHGWGAYLGGKPVEILPVGKLLKLMDHGCMPIWAMHTVCVPYGTRLVMFLLLHLPHCLIDPAELFTWALPDRIVSQEEAMLCARRQPGRSWETLREELAKLGELDWSCNGSTSVQLQEERAWTK